MEYVQLGCNKSYWCRIYVIKCLKQECNNYTTHEEIVCKIHKLCKVKDCKYVSINKKSLCNICLLRICHSCKKHKGKFYYKCKLLCFDCYNNRIKGFVIVSLKRLVPRDIARYIALKL